MVAELTAALKAIPALVEVIGQLGDSIKQAQADAIDNKYEKLKERVDELATQIENAETDEDRRILIRDLNSLQL